MRLDRDCIADPDARDRLMRWHQRHRGCAAEKRAMKRLGAHDSRKDAGCGPGHPPVRASGRPSSVRCGPESAWKFRPDISAAIEKAGRRLVALGIR